MSQALIRKMLESRLNTWATTRVPALSVAWENRAFDTPNGSYLRAFLLPAPTTSDDLFGSHRSYVGVFQVSVVTLDGLGAGTGESVAGEIQAQFPLNLRLTDTGVTVQLITPMSIGRAEQEPDRYTIPVSCTYRSDTI